MVWKQIALSFSDVNQALVEIDFSGIGVVSKDDFRNVINKHAIRLSPEQVYFYLSLSLDTNVQH